MNTFAQMLEALKAAYDLLLLVETGNLPLNEQLTHAVIRRALRQAIAAAERTKS
jgi:hypothetical protein